MATHEHKTNANRTAQPQSAAIVKIRTHAKQRLRTAIDAIQGIPAPTKGDPEAKKAPTAGHVAALSLIWSHTNDDDQNAWPSVKTISKQLFCSERHVRRLLQDLVAAGVLEAVPRGRGCVYSVVGSGHICPLADTEVWNGTQVSANASDTDGHRCPETTSADTDVRKRTLMSAQSDTDVHRSKQAEEAEPSQALGDDDFGSEGQASSVDHLTTSTVDQPSALPDDAEVRALLLASLSSKTEKDLPADVRDRGVELLAYEAFSIASGMFEDPNAEKHAKGFKKFVMPWLQAGLDFDRVFLPLVRTKAENTKSGTVLSWNYLKDAVYEADKKPSQPTEVAPFEGPSTTVTGAIDRDLARYSSPEYAGIGV